MPHRAEDVELTPEQPDAVVERGGSGARAGRRRPDPWWQAGLEEQLEQ